ncbi:zinc finger and BTB domain-containing protein 21 isoform X2 [Papio anubis]|uniref:Zinc finger and BTB domain containing 21 n=2 Tax=Cercopithecinae TaxID=9528 RepID=A0A8I5NF09_PAPAN|nr:zinc finger and BTB domain-containing protein 21 isoform X2 [Papio anubis]XP_021791184.2 zinc finger and BTB domain-containing protein 21 isoform X2 [Papio anubis]XP_025236757.1 zinc finger and BTB domain-containing protein 21 isoform X3 [Theropithecus gelada]XP_025236758.1 zinc finger and BTB domain-containing protein 21 isoform X3 [Theropithecus gelada]XP_031521625.1 zinc finger and BTB domain-containing protein 21 isoform X2 [Papio anubis]
MEGLLHYINPAHAISLLSALNEERLKGQLCDVLLIVGDQKFRAHKNVLAASSEYFQSLFTNKENESQAVFQLDFCEPDAFDNVLNYIYSSSLFVEKSSLAAVQELGYSLGISFLTNIVSKTPQAPFPTCPNRKKVFVEDDENSSQKRSVIVCQSRNEAQGKTVSQNQPDVSHTSRPSPSIAVKANTNKPHVPKPIEPLHSLSLTEKSWPKDSSVGYAKSLEHSGSLDDPNRISLVKRNAVLPSKPLQDREAMDDKPGVSGQLPKGKALELALKRPRPPVLSLCSSSETPYVLKETNKGNGQGEDRNLLYYSKLGLVIPSSGSGSGNQSIDRSGPLVKSLLRRSLSMDSQVPVYSPSIDLKSSQGSSSVSSDAPGNMLCALSQKSSLKDCSEKTAQDDRPQVLQPHRLRSFSASQSTDREGASPVTEVRIKTEPSSPLSDPSDIIRVTVGDAAATAAASSSSVTRDLSLKTEDDQKDMSRLPAKRRFQADRRLPFKKLKVNEHGSPVSEDNFEEGSSPTILDADFPDSDLNKDEFEQGSHERLCRNAAVCPYCSLRFFSPELKQEHESKCEYKKLTCLECMRTFKSSFSIWRHQVEVHNQNNMAPTENFSLPVLDHNGDVTGSSRPQSHPEPNKVNHIVTTKDDNVFSDSSEQVNFDSEDSSCLPEDLSLSKQLKIQVKEEPVEEAEEEAPEASTAPKEAGPSKEASLWPCEKCGKMFTVHKQLERHQELLCSVKPFICHVCNKAFRTNFRLWSHFQSHMSQASEESAHKESEVCPVPTNSPSPPPLPPPPPLPKIQPLEPDSPTGLSENPTPATEKLFVPQESDTLFYHAPPLSAITFKRQFMCKLCHRTFKTAFSLWSHEQTHN